MNALALFVCILVPAAAFGQPAIAGAVKDSSGAPLAGVEAEASGPALIEKNRTAVTDSTGRYRIEDLRPGRYRVTFRLAGWQPFARDGVELTGSLTAIVNAELAIGALTAEVIVTAASPSVDLRSPNHEVTLSSAIVKSIRSVRSYNAILPVIPGIVTSTNDTITGTATTAFPIYGGRSNEGRLLLDGMNIGSPPAGNSAASCVVDVGNAQEVAFSSAAVLGEFETAGLVMNIVPQAGGNTTRGSFFGSGTDGRLQSNNITRALADQGVVAGPPVLVLSRRGGTLRSPWWAIAAGAAPWGGSAGRVDYYSEALDQARFARVDYQTAFRDSLRLKYEQQRFDLVIPIGDIPVDFVEKNRDDLFPDAAVVFFANRPPGRRLPNSTGLIVPLNLTGTIDLAATLHPNLQNIFVISSAGVSYEDVARAQFRSFGSRFAITFLSGLPTKALEARLASLPENSIVYYLNVDRDGADQLFRPLDYLDRIAAVSNAPVYCWVDSTLGHGVVGGSLKVQEVQMKTTGAIALRVLRGEPADSIPVSSPDLNVNQVDWRELRRWRISEALVPSGTIVRFRELSVWDRYKIYILVTGAAFVAETILIAGLLAQRTGRRRAEDEARRRQAALRRSYDRLRDLGARLLEAQETERSRIARELHDDISQQMALLEIDLELLAEAVDARAVDLAGEVLHRASGIAKSVHDLSHRLHPEKLRLIGLPAALDGLQRELSPSDVVINIESDDVPALPPDLTLCLFRVVQEALQNALKHSHARRVSVSLAVLHSKIRIAQGMAVVLALGVSSLVASAQGSRYWDGQRFTRLEAGMTINVRTAVAIDAARSDYRVYNGIVDEDVLGTDGHLAIPRGSTVELIARREDGDLVLDLESVTVNGQRYAILTDSSQVVGTAGSNDLVGSILGAITNGAIRGQAVRIPRDTVMTFRLDRGLDIGVADQGVNRGGYHYHDYYGRGRD